MRNLFSWIGAMMIWIGIKWSVIAGGLFEGALQSAIVEFGSIIQTIKPGIDAGWSALRDISNIVIIGLFVFIAINIILGVKEFGEKKAIAKILIVAVLINFSLLFTKVIVDASNFTAYQFYNSMVKGIEAQSTSVAGLTTVKSVIAPKFMQLLGVQGIMDSRDQLFRIANSNENAFYALFYGLLSFIFLIAVALVFLYGAFLIISRAVLIVFLMLTASLAFATWLIPQNYVGGLFKKWWESLIKAAFFAPILVAFLWMTLKVSEPLVFSAVLGEGGTLGKLASDASSSANIAALLNFAIVLGLLFASMATAKTLSSGIPGFKLATTGVGGSLVGASRLGGILGRNSLGWGGEAALRGLRRYTDPDRRGVVGAINRGARRTANYLATSRYDLLQKAPIKSAVASMGGPLTGTFVDKTAGLTKDDFRTVMEKKAQKADTLARAIGPTQEQQNAIRDQAQQQINTQTQGFQRMVDTQQRTLRQARAKERPGVEAAVREGQTDREGAEQDVREAQRRSSEAESNLRAVERNIENAHRNAAAGGTTDQAELEALERQRAQFHAETPQLRQNLEAATRALDGLNRQAQELAEIQLDEHANVGQARAELQRSEADLRAHRERTQTLAVDIVAAHNQAFREQLLWDRRARPFVAGEMRGQAGRDAMRAALAEINRGNPPAAPATPTRTP